MNQNLLLLNQDKTGVIVLGDKEKKVAYSILSYCLYKPDSDLTLSGYTVSNQSPKQPSISIRTYLE